MPGKLHILLIHGKYYSLVSEQRDRPFRVSDFAPNGSNIALALYRCGTEYRIKTFVNEYITEIPGCPLDVNDTCSYDDFAALFNDRADSCNFDQICTVQ